VFFFLFFPANFGICHTSTLLPRGVSYCATWHILCHVSASHWPRWATCQLLIRRGEVGMGKSSFDPEVEVILSGYATSTSGLIILDQVYE